MGASPLGLLFFLLLEEWVPLLRCSTRNWPLWSLQNMQNLIARHWPGWDAGWVSHFWDKQWCAWGASDHPTDDQLSQCMVGEGNIELTVSEGSLWSWTFNSITLLPCYFPAIYLVLVIDINVDFLVTLCDSFALKIIKWGSWFLFVLVAILIIMPFRHN